MEIWTHKPPEKKEPPNIEYKKPKWKKIDYVSNFIFYMFLLFLLIALIS